MNWDLFYYIYKEIKNTKIYIITRNKVIFENSKRWRYEKSKCTYNLVFDKHLSCNHSNSHISQQKNK